jgi:hypothetical protein
MCKEMPVIPVKRVVATNRIIGKNGGPRRRKAQGAADPRNISILFDAKDERNYSM